jgi:hypothetical protein
MKILKFAFAALTAVSLLSCDAFLAPLKGRFNPSDPYSDLDPITLTLFPVVDGWVSDADKDFANADFTIRAGVNFYGFIKFNFGELPDIITEIKLRIYHSSASSVNNVIICRIGKDWDPSSVDYAMIISPGFMLMESSSEINVANDSYGVWDIYTMFKMGAERGFIVRLDAITTYFTSMEGTNKPQLVIKGFNFPETE